jgi:hypothetical protein
VTEPRRALRALPDDELAQALRELATSVAFPPPSVATAGAVDTATAVRRRIEELPPRLSIWQRLRWAAGTSGARAGEAAGARSRLGGRPIRRGLVLALAALLILAAVAGAVGLGLPGLRIIFGEPPSPQPTAGGTLPGQTTASGATPSATLAPLGGSLALGDAVSFAEAQRQAGFDVVLPTDPDLGPPDASYLNGQRVGLIWATRPGLPDTESPGVGLVISEFRGTVDERYFEKILGPDTTLTRVTVGGSPGYWISGAPHFFFYIDPKGQAVNDDHPTVGDVLLWTNGDVTYRLETSLGMAAAIRLAESLR